LRATEGFGDVAFASPHASDGFSGWYWLSDAGVQVSSGDSCPPSCTPSCRRTAQHELLTRLMEEGESPVALHSGKGVGEQL